MISQQETDYERIAEAIRYLRTHYKNQPNLDTIAGHVNVSPYHFQRMFQEWAGITPKRFLQYLSLEHARQILKDTRITLSDAAIETGLSGTSRLYDLFIKIEGMTPGEYQNGGEALTIRYSYSNTPFGRVLVASTHKGICAMSFTNQDSEQIPEVLAVRYPNATFRHETDEAQRNALSIFGQDWTKLREIKLHLKGSAFQLRVWETLLTIPLAGLTTYADLASQAGYAGASRAVGTAIGKNPVAFLIPCHRVIRSTGETGQYFWGEDRKKAIIGWEAARVKR